MAQGNIKFTYHAGALVAGQIKSAIKSMCFERGFGCQIEKFGGWFSSDYGVTIMGDHQKLTAFKSILQQWFDQMNDQMNDSK